MVVGVWGGGAAHLGWGSSAELATEVRRCCLCSWSMPAGPWLPEGRGTLSMILRGTGLHAGAQTALHCSML